LTTSRLNPTPASGRIPLPRLTGKRRPPAFRPKKITLHTSGGSLSDVDTAKFTQFLKDLDEFDTEGRAYGEVYGELKKLKSLLAGLKTAAV
jgi:hypothetical protein